MCHLNLHLCGKKVKTLANYLNLSTILCALYPSIHTIYIFFFDKSTHTIFQILIPRLLIFEHQTSHTFRRAETRHSYLSPCNIGGECFYLQFSGWFWSLMCFGTPTWQIGWRNCNGISYGVRSERGLNFNYWIGMWSALL